MKNLNQISYYPPLVLLIVFKDLLEFLKDIKMETSIEWTNIIFDLFIILFLFWILRGLRRFTKGYLVQLFTYLSIINKIFEKNPDIAEDYMRDIEGMKKLNPIKKETLDYIFTFNEGSNYKQRIKDLTKKINESNRDNK